MILPIVADDALRPDRMHPHDAGLDLCAAEPARIAVGAMATISTGVRVAIPEGNVGYVHVRSSMGFKHGVSLANGTGVIDSEYRGVIHAALINHGQRPVTINRGDRILQLVIHPIVIPELEYMDTLDETSRGTQGIGSTGK